MNLKTSVLPALIALALLMGSVGAQQWQYCGSAAQGGTVTAIAPWYCSQIDQAVRSVWLQWEPIAVLAIFVSFSIAAAIFMTGIVLRSNKIRNMGIGEIYEAVATTIIVFLFMSLSATLFGIIPGFITGPINPYTTSLGYIAGTITTSSSMLTGMYRIIMIDYFYSSIDLQVCEGNVCTPDIVNDIAAGVFIFFVVPVQQIAVLLIDGLLALHLQFYLILFFMYVSIPVFLVPGIVFRAILPTRPLGGLMIAMAISFYLIMPVLFSVAYYFTNVSLIGNLQNEAAMIVSNGQGTQALTNAASPTAPLVLAVQQVQSSMGSYFLSILFYPALITAITYESIRVIADFIGGAVKSTGKLSQL